MKPSLSFLALLLLTVAACPDDHDHSHAHAPHKREYPEEPLSLPSRPLEWGDLNIIHTTDTHGWLLGHQKTSFPEPNYSGDLGDFASFIAHMQQIAIEKDVDLLLVDSGDLHDGTGLSDGFPAGGLDGHETDKFFLDLPYDVMAIGNHELYDYNITYDMYANFAPAIPGRYLSSNANVTVFDANGNAVSVPVGARYRKFTTRKGRKITSLGVIFDFTGNDVNTTVQPVADMVQESWFAEAIAEEPDVFVLAGHMPVSEDNWPTVFNAIRDVHPDTPIMILGGHTHIRDCVQFDGRSMALESGRYMETVGWLSANLTANEDGNITFTRRYLDQNRVTYEYHALTSNTSFDTAEGSQITQGLLALADKYDINYQFGIAPQDYYLTQAPYPSDNSSLSLYIQKAAPVALAINNTRATIPNIMIVNSGTQRFDVYSGPFTVNDQWAACPYYNSFVYIPNVTLSVATQVVPALNQPSAQAKKRSLIESQREAYRKGDVDMVYQKWLREMNRRYGMAQKRASENATLGYVTSDSCPGVGDDTLHTPVASYDTPVYIGSDPPVNVSSSELVDLVCTNYIADDILAVLNTLQSDKNYTSSDVLPYSNVLTNSILGLYAEQAWN